LIILLYRSRFQLFGIVVNHLRHHFITFTVSIGITQCSKRFIRYDGSDLFNPSALALVLITTFSSHAYIFPGAWGALGMAALILFGIGLLLFAFVTTADSKTTPVHFSVRMVFAVSVALLVALLHFKFYLSTAAIYALVVLAPLVTYFKYLHKEYI